jgi:DNA-binding transcriptional MerR regulator
VDISHRQLDHWARAGLLEPPVPAAGRGSARRYSYRDLLSLKVVRRLLEAGLSLRAARLAVEALRRHGNNDLSRANLVIGDHGSVLTYSGEEIMDLLDGRQPVLNIVPLSGVVSELAAAIPDARGR